MNGTRTVWLCALVVVTASLVLGPSPVSAQKLLHSYAIVQDDGSLLIKVQERIGAECGARHFLPQVCKYILQLVYLIGIGPGSQYLFEQFPERAVVGHGRVQVEFADGLIFDALDPQILSGNFRAKGSDLLLQAFRISSQLIGDTSCAMKSNPHRKGAALCR